MEKARAKVEAQVRKGNACAMLLRTFNSVCVRSTQVCANMRTPRRACACEKDIVYASCSHEHDSIRTDFLHLMIVFDNPSNLAVHDWIDDDDDDAGGDREQRLLALLPFVREVCGAFLDWASDVGAAQRDDAEPFDSDGESSNGDGDDDDDEAAAAPHHVCLNDDCEHCTVPAFVVRLTDLADCGRQGQCAMQKRARGDADAVNLHTPYGINALLRQRIIEQFRMSAGARATDIVRVMSNLLYERDGWMFLYSHTVRRMIMRERDVLSRASIADLARDYALLAARRGSDIERGATTFLVYSRFPFRAPTATECHRFKLCACDQLIGAGTAHAESRRCQPHWHMRWSQLPFRRNGITIKLATVLLLSKDPFRYHRVDWATGLVHRKVPAGKREQQ